MAIAYDSGIDAVAASASSITSGSFTVGSGSDRYMLVAVSWVDSFAGDYNVTACKWGGSGGEDLTQIGTATLNNTFKMAVYRRLAPTSQTSTVYATIDGSVTRLAVLAMSYTGVDQAAPIGTPTISVPESNTPSGTQTLGTDEWIVGFLTTDGNTITPGTQNQRNEDENTNMSISGDDWTTGSLSWTTTGVFDRNIVWVVNLKPAGGGGGATSLLPASVMQRYMPLLQM